MKGGRFLLAAGALFCAGIASAETIDKKVKANTTTALGGLFIYTIQTCEPGVIPDAKIGAAPRNGSAVVRMHQTTLGSDTNCAGKKITGPIFVYTPNKGFKGTDEFTIEYPFARAESRPPAIMSTTYRITVE